MEQNSEQLQFRRPVYRAYLDEVGHANYKCDLNHSQNRFLSVTGVFIDLRYVESTLSPHFEAIKHTYFKPPHHPDSPVVLHRNDIKGKRYPFANLKDSSMHSDFDAHLINCLTEWDYRVVTVTVDKLAMSSRYAVPFDAYHYCMTVILERFLYFLIARGLEGDVMAEARQKHENRSLKAEYTRIYSEGTRYDSADDFRKHITSNQIKIKEKVHNIVGLQLADLIAYSCFHQHAHLQVGYPVPSAFCRRIIAELERFKYERNPQTGVIEGYGRKWFP
ncbi:MAG: DUF3800 domain-containing protein [bacterium]